METSKDREVVNSCLPSERNIVLIEEVKKFPSLYDTSNPDYYVLAERNKAWLQVAENCGEPADQCHLRWKSLRKRYAKERKKLPDIVQGHHKPWALYPKMSFVGPVIQDNRQRIKPKTVRNINSSVEDYNKNTSEDDMLILGENNEIVRTCKSSEVSEEDEYIYETLDDPDSALEIMNSKLLPKMKATAIRSGKATRPPPAVPSRVGGSGRIRKLTPKMQNSFIAKKLKHAQQIMQQTSIPSQKQSKTTTDLSKNCVVKLNKTTPNKIEKPRYSGTVSPNSFKLENARNLAHSLIKQNNISNEPESSSPKGGQGFKMVKLKGRNPMIFSPEQLPDIQSFLKTESKKEQSEMQDKSPGLKVKSVDNLNSMSGSSTSNENVNLDIIHSVGLMRKTSTEKRGKSEKTSQQSYSRTYSWNRPEVKSAKQATEKAQPQPDSQTNDFEIEEAWNDIKQENVDETYWTQPPEQGYLPPEPMVMIDTPEFPSRGSTLNTRVAEARLELIAYQRRLMEEQHKRTLEYMKREHDLKMVLLKAEIDLKRKQLNIML